MRVCEQCGKEFPRRENEYPSRYQKRRFCGYACSYQAKKAAGKMQPRSCEPGCTCERHSMRQCDLDCSCGKHSDDFGYWGRHARVRHKRGSASEYECIACDKQAEQWAQIHDTDGTDPWNHYQPMCRKCHWWYDEEAHRAIYTTRKTDVTEETRTKRAAIIKKWWDGLTPEERDDVIKRRWETRRRNAEKES